MNTAQRIVVYYVVPLVLAVLGLIITFQTSDAFGAFVFDIGLYWLVIGAFLRSKWPQRHERTSWLIWALLLFPLIGGATLTHEIADFFSFIQLPIRAVLGAGL